jgi:dihydrolipoamide dehydrogenase
MAKHEFDVVVVGGGPGGYVAAIRSSQLGMKTALVEREHLGGICLNWGCIPTKALLRTAEIYALMHHIGDFGLKAKDLGYDFPKVIKRSRQVASQLNRGVQHLMKKNKVQVFDGQGRLDGKRTVAVAKDGKATESVQAEHVILATGARARTLPGLEPDGKHIWTYKEAMVPEEMPNSVLVIGSGAIGIEFASFYDHLGADVTVVEVLDRVLPVEDEEISAFARKQFEKRGFKIHTKAKVSGLEVTNGAVQAKIEPEGGTPETITVDRVVLAVGIVGNVEDIGLENTGVKVEGSHVVTDEWLRTGEPGVYAIGDVAGPPWLAHKSSHEGVVCVERIKGLNTVHPLDVTKIPGCTYCAPQVASVGLTERAAKDQGYEVKVGRFPYVGNGKAIALGETEGMVKTVFDARTGELLGAHMIGAEVTELIHGYVLARQVEATELDLMHTIYPHPTLSEMMHEAVLDAYGQAIHF